MHLSLDEFCVSVQKAKRTNADKALAVLWFFDREQPGVAKSAGQLTKILGDHHIGTPNQTALSDAIRRTKLAAECKDGFLLKPGSRRIIRDWLPDLEGIQPTIDQAAGFLPQPIWRNTRGYIEEVCRELNGSFHHAYFNAAAVLLRRLLETLVIESYEYLGRDEEIKIGGNYLMLSELTERACGESGHKGLNLGRESKKALKDARNIGNYSAHARRFLAHAGDLTKLQMGTRLVVQELVQIANLHRRDKQSAS